jgi:hypothetical protein
MLKGTVSSMEHGKIIFGTMLQFIYVHFLYFATGSVVVILLGVLFKRKGLSGLGWLVLLISMLVFVIFRFLL